MNNLVNVFIIAEAGVNHNGSIENALKMVDIASDSGADAIKFQSFIASEMLTKNVEKASYQKKNTNMNENHYDMIEKLELTPKMHEKIISRCIKKNIKFLSTPFDLKSLDLLVNDFGLDTIKISSGDITNAPLLLATAKNVENIILSTGMSEINDIDNALGVIAYGLINKNNYTELNSEKLSKTLKTMEAKLRLSKSVKLLHCTSEYPAPYVDVNLNVISDLKAKYSLPIGYSDHTKGIHVSLAAVAMGAMIIEKHFTLDINMSGPDHLSSLNPRDFNLLVKNIRDIEKAKGDKIKVVTESEKKNLLIARKFLVASKSIRKGQVFTLENIQVKRSGGGISPLKYW